MLIGALIALVRPMRERRWDVRCSLFAAATVLMIVVGLMTEAGFAGNLRYVALPAALVCVLAGVGWVDLVAAAGGALRAPARGGARRLRSWSARGAFLVVNLDKIRDGVERTRSEADAYNNLPAAIAKAGGIDAFRRCKVYTGHFQVPAVAWYLKRTPARSASTPSPRASSSRRATAPRRATRASRC